MKLKKVMALMLTMTLGLSMAGCGSSSSSVSSTDTSGTETTTETRTDTEETTGDITGTITVLTNRTDLVDTSFAEYKKTFEEKYPGTEVKFEGITDYEGDVSIRMQTKEYGDVLMVPNNVKSNLLSTYFEPLGTVDELSEKYNKSYLYAKQSDNVVYGLASLVNVQGVVYNKKVFEAAGITELPKTPDEFLDALRKIKEKGECENPYYTNYAAGWTLTQWQDHAWGSCTADPDYHNNVICNERDPFTEGKSNYVVHKLLYDIIKEGLCEKDPVTTDWEASKGMLGRGEIGCMVLGSWAISQMQDAAENPDDIGYMPFPYSIDGQQYATAGADYCFGINKNSSNKATARAWIDFMVDESGYALSQGGISIVKDAPLPDTLKDFTGIEYVIDNPATADNEGKTDILSNESEINFYAEQEKQRICEAAMGNTDETFDEIMDDWNKRWAEALDEYVAE